MDPSHAFRSLVASIRPSPVVTTGKRIARLGRWAPFVYLFATLPTVLFLTVLTPPFQSPDEPNHFRRAVGILGGGIVAHRTATPGQAGSVLPTSTAEVADAFMSLPGHPEAKYAPAAMQRTFAVRWDRSQKAFSDFANTAIYPPIFYGPVVGALALGRGLDWGVMDSYRLARSINGMVAVALAVAAIGFAGRARSLLFVILSSPTVLFLFASVSQDALLIAGTALAAALCWRAVQRSERRTWPERLVAALLLGAAMAARPPYAFLLAALAMPRPVRPDPSRVSAMMHRGWPVALALAFGLGWLVLGAAPAQVPMRVGSGVSIPGQMLEMVRHPLLFPSALSYNLRWFAGSEYEEAIGVLGWTETLLPGPVYAVAGAALIVGTVLASGGRVGLPLRRWGCVLLACMAAAFVAVHGALFLSWTPVGSGAIEGFQGRYLLPIAALAAVALPAITARRPGPPEPAADRLAGLRSFGWAALFALAAVSDLWLPFAVFDRYYA